MNISCSYNILLRGFLLKNIILKIKISEEKSEKSIFYLI